MADKLALAAAELYLALQEADEVDDCKKHPAYLLEHVKCMDEATGEEFTFQLLDPEAGWYWQREVLDSWIEYAKAVILKARQLGITWLAAGYALWMVLYRPGTQVLIISINEEEASKVVNRIWDMMMSLPKHLRNGVEVVKPSKDSRPSLHIELRHVDGKMSYVTGLPSTKKAGHGRTAALVILDEFARHEYARESWKALVPTTSSGGKLVAISTGNGISTTTAQGDTSGNFFHSLWKTEDEENTLYKKFLRWDLHPDRDDSWYRTIAMAIPNKADRAEQFPATEREAFILTGDPFFDMDSLQWYSDHALRAPKYRMKFEAVTADTAKITKLTGGPIRVFSEPQPGRKYALSADVATGRGADYSSGRIIDLQTMELCAQIHAKIDSDLYAFQLHYLGKWFNTAWLAVEMAGGYGEPVVLSLRDGREGRPAYPNMYLHRQLDRGDQPQAKPYGFPMNMKTRATVVDGVAEAIRDRLFPYLDEETLGELQTFVHRNTNPSPRAQDGCNDDRVMDLGIAVELFRQRGAAPAREKRRAQRVKKPHVNPYPWQPA